MRPKHEILNDLEVKARRLDSEHQDLAHIAMIETEVQIDIRDILEMRLLEIVREFSRQGKNK